MSEENQDYIEDIIKTERELKELGEEDLELVSFSLVSEKNLIDKNCELKEEKIREASNEFDDGAFETYINENFGELSKEFCCEDYNDEFRDYCKEKFNEVNK